MMRVFPGLAAIGLVAYFATAGSAAIFMTVDRYSPIVSPGGITPADVLISTPDGVRVAIQGSRLGLQTTFNGQSYEGDDLNAVSIGRDPFLGSFLFSVDRLSVGLPDTAVFNQGSETDAGVAGDIYLALLDVGSNRLMFEETELGLTPGSLGDDLNGLSLLPPLQGVYFSIDLFSASNAGLDLASAIFLNDLGTVFASSSDIGLRPEDDLDALVMWDVFEPGVLNPGIDRALFSISRDSSLETLGAYSPADVLFTDFRGTISVHISAAQLGLAAATDDLNALSVVAVPEPANCCCWVLVAGGVLACGGWSRRRR